MEWSAAWLAADRFVRLVVFVADLAGQSACCCLRHCGAKISTVDIRWMRVSVAVWFVVGSAMAYEYLQIQKDFVVVRFQNLRAGVTPADYVAPDVFWLSHLGAMLNVVRHKAVRHTGVAELENLRRTSLRFPYASLGLRYAIALGLNGFPEAASRPFAIMQGLYGPVYYDAAVDVLRQLQSEKYPELSQVLTP